MKFKLIYEDTVYSDSRAQALEDFINAIQELIHTGDLGKFITMEQQDKTK